MNFDLQKHINNAIEEWERLDYYNYYNRNSVNTFIDKYESVLVSCGMFMRGLRVEPVPTNELAQNRHKTLDGVLGILSMNMYIFKEKNYQLEELPKGLFQGFTDLEYLSLGQLEELSDNIFQGSS